jgi:hypothetical protein
MIVSLTKGAWSGFIYQGMKQQLTEKLCVQREKVVNTCEARCCLKKMMDEEQSNKSETKSQKAEEIAIGQEYPMFAFCAQVCVFVIENSAWAGYSLANWTDTISGPAAPPPWLA